MSPSPPPNDRRGTRDAALYDDRALGDGVFNKSWGPVVEPPQKPGEKAKLQYSIEWQSITKTWFLGAPENASTASEIQQTTKSQTEIVASWMTEMVKRRVVIR